MPCAAKMRGRLQTVPIAAAKARVPRGRHKVFWETKSVGAARRGGARRGPMHLLLGADSISDDYVRKALGLPPLRAGPCDDVPLTTRSCPTEPDRLEQLPPVVPPRRPLSHRAKKSILGAPRRPRLPALLREQQQEDTRPSGKGVAFTRAKRWRPDADCFGARHNDVPGPGARAQIPVVPHASAQPTLPRRRARTLRARPLPRAAADMHATPHAPQAHTSRRPPSGGRPTRCSGSRPARCRSGRGARA